VVVSTSNLPDWSRERRDALEWAPFKSLLSAIRIYQATRDRPGILAGLRWRLAATRWRFWSVIGGINIPLRCQIGGGLQMPHTNGIVINSGARIGCNCEIFQQVTIGEGKGGCPEIGNNVSIGPGAKILGGVRVGDGSRIGANALVVRDVPEGSLVLAALAEIHTRPLTPPSSP
jgi:serine O-acetyltransferase